MTAGHAAPSSPVVPIDVSFIAPTDGRAGLWRVLHVDGTQLFESPVEAEARGRLDALKDMARIRMSAGHQVTGKDMLVLFPPAAPASLLLSATADEELQREDVLDPESRTWTMRNVEVFRSGVALKRVAGEWKQLSFTADDVQDLVEAFAALGWTPPVKVTHASEQPIVLEQLPSLARAVALRAAKVKGQGSVEFGAFADLEKVPDALYGAIRAGKLFQRSIEFWRNRIPRPAGGTYPMVLKAVALLGDELPAVRGMPPIDVAPAKFSVEEPFESVTLTLTQEKQPHMDPANKAGAENVIQLSAEEYAKLKQQAESASQEATRLKAEHEASSKRIAKLEADRRIESATSAAARLRDSGKITPAQEPFVLEILKSLDDDNKDAVSVTLSTKDGTAKESKHSQRGAFLAFLDTLSVHPAAPARGARTLGQRNPGTDLNGGFDALSAEDRKTAIANLGEKYFADAQAAKQPITQLAAYEKARKDLTSGAVELTEEVIRG